MNILKKKIIFIFPVFNFFFQEMFFYILYYIIIPQLLNSAGVAVICLEIKSLFLDQLNELSV